VLNFCTCRGKNMQPSDGVCLKGKLGANACLVFFIGRIRFLPPISLTSFLAPFTSPLISHGCIPNYLPLLSVLQSLKFESLRHVTSMRSEHNKHEVRTCRCPPLTSLPEPEDLGETFGIEICNIAEWCPLLTHRLHVLLQNDAKK